MPWIGVDIRRPAEQWRGRIRLEFPGTGAFGKTGYQEHNAIFINGDFFYQLGIVDGKVSSVEGKGTTDGKPPCEVPPGPSKAWAGRGAPERVSHWFEEE
jgi:hypothetical protein